MQWKNDVGEDDIQEKKISEDYLDDEDFSPWKGNSRITDFFGRSGAALAIISVGILIVIILVFLFFTGGDSGQLESRLTELEVNYKSIKASINELAQPKGPTTLEDELTSKLNVLKERLDRVEGSVSDRMNQVSEKIDVLERTIIVPKKVVSQKTKKKSTVSAKSSTAKHYTVKKGDTLYSIARDNSVTVEAIMKANSLKTSDLKLNQELKLP